MITHPRSYDDLEDNFWELEPNIDEWDSYGAVSYEEIPKIPGYIGMGNHAFAVRVQHAGQDIALRYGFSNDTKSRVQHTEKYITPLLKGVGIAHAEQVIAAHRLYGFVLSHYVEGEDSYGLSLDEVRELPESTIKTMASTLLQMRGAGIYPDCAGDNNILYNRESQTFSFIDYVDDTIMGPHVPVRKVATLLSLAIGRRTLPKGAAFPRPNKTQKQFRNRLLAYMEM